MSLLCYNLGGSQSSKVGSNTNKEGLDISFDDLAIQHIEMGIGKWSNTSAWFIKVVKHILDRLNFKENNTKSRKHFQPKTCLAVQVIKVI